MCKAPWVFSPQDKTTAPEPSPKPNPKLGVHWEDHVFHTPAVKGGGATQHIFSQCGATHEIFGPQNKKRSPRALSIVTEAALPRFTFSVFIMRQEPLAVFQAGRHAEQHLNALVFCTP